VGASRLSVNNAQAIPPLQREKPLRNEMFCVTHQVFGMTSNRTAGFPKHFFPRGILLVAKITANLTDTCLSKYSVRMVGIKNKTFVSQN